MMRRIPAAFFVFLLAFAPAAQAAEKTAVGDVCSGDQSRADWDAIFQCVSNQFKRAALWLGSSSDTCDSGKAGLLQWTGTSFQVCDGGGWKALGTAGSGLLLGTSAGATNPARPDDITTGLFSSTAATVSTAISGTERFKVNANGVDVPNLANAYYLAGNKVLFQPASDTSSIAVGPGALASQSATNLYNTAVGYHALYQTTTGQNVAVGYAAAAATTTGYNATAVGFNALQYNTTGSNNTSVGAGSLQFNTTGSYNTAVGMYAMLSSTPNNLTGNYNTGMGYKALQNVQTTAAGNTALGANTGLTLTTGTGNILIGANANVPSATQSNFLNIGNTLYGDTASGWVGIRTGTPVSALHVDGTITSGSTQSTLGSIVLQGYYSATNALSVWGTEYSSGGPVTGYGVTPSTSASGSFLSSTTLAIPRAAMIVGASSGTTKGDIVFFTGTSQTVAVGSAVTMSKVMTIQNGGYVGIGTMSPTHLLTLAMSSTSGASALSPSISITNTNTAVGDEVTTTNTSHLRMIAGNGTVDTRVIASYGSIFSGGKYGTNTNHPMAFMTNAMIRAVIDTSGNVGIGTTSPGAKLDLSSGGGSGTWTTSNWGRGIQLPNASVIKWAKGASNAWGIGQTADRLYFIYSTTDDNSIAGTHPLVLNGTGNVGIGTISPSDKLHVVGGTSGANTGIFRIENNAAVPSSNTGASIEFYSKENTPAQVEMARIGTLLTDGAAGAASSALAFYTRRSGTLAERMRISWDGSVGIGTTAPAATLDVNGYAKLKINSSAPVACSSTYDGSIALNSVYTLCICKGGSSAWVKASDGSTACSW